MRRLNQLCCLLLCFLMLNPAFSRQQDNIKYRKNSLKQLDGQIENLQSNLQQQGKKQQDFNKQLRNIEVSMSNLNKKLLIIEQKLCQQNNKLSTLHQQQQQAKINLVTQQEKLSNQIRTTYMVSKQDPIKLLLNQKDPHQFSRSLVYFNYFNQSRLKVIAQLNMTLKTLDQTSHAINHEKRLLLQLQQNKSEERAQLQKQHKQRKVLLSNLNKNITNAQLKLSQLKKNKAQLEKIIAELQKPRSLRERLQHSDFAKLRHHLIWPAQGIISVRFGTRIEHSDLKWNGILIDAKQGSDVHAVFPGKVVFANWLNGFGELLIIDHGHGYMTLYGRNQTLLKDVGEYVTENETIAKVGNSGGYNKSSLYFEIRHNGYPVAPESWVNPSLKP